jgi:DNA topoisomerase IA
MVEKLFQPQVCQVCCSWSTEVLSYEWIGLIVQEKNYLNVFIYEKWEGHHIPVFEEGEEFEPTVCDLREGQTTKPNYLTEADLVTRMDKNGIGLSLRCG